MDEMAPIPRRRWLQFGLRIVVAVWSLAFVLAIRSKWHERERQTFLSEMYRRPLSPKVQMVYPSSRMSPLIGQTMQMIGIREPANYVVSRIAFSQDDPQVLVSRARLLFPEVEIVRDAKYFPRAP
jgi:hypothetical protein